MSFGWALGHRIAIHADLHHGGWWILLKVISIPLGESNAGEQAIVEGNRNKMVLLLFHLSEQGGGGSLEDALNTAFWRASSPPLSKDSNQNAVSVPGVIQLMIADVDVIPTIVPDREAEPLAAAAKSSLDQVWIATPANPFAVAAVDHAQTAQRREGHLEGLLIALLREFERFGENRCCDRLIS